MTLYRILVDLDRCKAGTLDPLAGVKPEAIERLIGGGFIAPLAAPPLIVLDGWARRAGRLLKVGIETGEQLLEADSADLARKLRVKAADIEQWKAEIKSWIMPA